MEPTTSVPWSVLIAAGASLISAMAGVIVALLASRIGRLEKQAEDNAGKLHALDLTATQHTGELAWLKASEGQRRDDHMPRELVIQRFEQQDQQLARIEAALERKVSVGTMPAVREPPRHHDPRADPESEPPSLPPMRGRLPSTRGR